MNTPIVAIVPDKTPDMIGANAAGKTGQDVTSTMPSTFSKVLKKVASCSEDSGKQEASATNSADVTQKDDQDEANVSQMMGLFSCIPLVLTTQNDGIVNDQASTGDTIQNVQPLSQDAAVITRTGVQPQDSKKLEMSSVSMNLASQESATAQTAASQVIPIVNQDVQTNQTVFAGNLSNNQTNKTKGTSNVAKTDVSLVKSMSTAVGALDNNQQKGKVVNENPQFIPVTPAVPMVTDGIQKAQYNAYGIKVVPGIKANTSQAEPVTPVASTEQTPVVPTSTQPVLSLTPIATPSSENVVAATEAVSTKKTAEPLATLQTATIEGENLTTATAPELLASKDAKATTTNPVTTAATTDDTMLQNVATMPVNVALPTQNLKDTSTKPEAVLPTNSEQVITGFVKEGLAKQGTSEFSQDQSDVGQSATNPLVQMQAQTDKSQQVFSLDTAQPNQTQSIVDKYDVVSQIVEHAKLINHANSSEMVIQLKPEHLGELTLKVVVENGSVSTTFHSNNPDVRSMIESSLSQLRQEMSNQGLKVDYVGVYAGLSQFSSQQQRENQQQSSFKFQSKKQAADEFNDSIEAVAQINSIGDPEGIDYRI